MIIGFDFFLALFVGIMLIRLGHRTRPDLLSFWRTIEISALFCFLADLNPTRINGHRPKNERLPGSPA
jgi:hypothetical protein